MSGPREPAPWILVAGGFHAEGGMDRLNAALARHLAASGAAVRLVAHRVDPAVAALPGVEVTLVRRPVGSILLGETLLDRAGRRAARAAQAADPRARVVVNGGNCAWGDVAWVHAVHAAWPCADTGAPAWFRAKNRLAKAAARRRERRIVPRARFVVANSERTRRDLVGRLGIAAERVRVVYPALATGIRPPSPDERAAARSRWCRDPERPLAVFAGALSHDRNKGFDVLLAAWERLSGLPTGPGAELVAAGGGGGVERWRAEVARRGLAGSVRLAGFIPGIAGLLHAADLLVAPSRYEAYGLAVHEAICRGVPALVSATAGVAERYPAGLSGFLLTDPEDSAGLADRLTAWRADPEAARRRFAPFAATLAAGDDATMAAHFVAEVAEVPGEVV